MGRENRTPRPADRPAPESSAVGAAELADRLAGERARADVERADDLARRSAAAQHRRVTADLETAERLADRDRVEAERDAVARAELAAQRRAALAAGERMRIRARLDGSGEARALRLERIRRANLWVMGGAMVIAGLVSMAGVQRGAAELAGAEPGDALWWLLWGLEPAILGGALWLIVLRAQLHRAGGTLAPSLELLGLSGLATSVALNAVAARVDVAKHAEDVGKHASAGEMAGAILTHAIAPVIACALAWGLGRVETNIADTDPWVGRDGSRLPTLDDADGGPDTFGDRHDAVTPPSPGAVSGPVPFAVPAGAPDVGTPAGTGGTVSGTRPGADGTSTGPAPAPAEVPDGAVPADVPESSGTGTAQVPTAPGAVSAGEHADGDDGIVVLDVEPVPSPTTPVAPSAVPAQRPGTRPGTPGGTPAGTDRNGGTGGGTRPGADRHGTGAGTADVPDAAPEPGPETAPGAPEPATVSTTDGDRNTGRTPVPEFGPSTPRPVVQQMARDWWTREHAAGREHSGAAVGAAFGASDRWGRARVAEARAELADDASRVVQLHR